jgi:hypothetical protein
VRRRIGDDLVVLEKKRLVDATADQQLALGFVETAKDSPLYEYAVLVTSLPDEILALGQHYRDRADAENNFDELKNQWGWSGFTTHDLKRCQIMARIIATVYNWWSRFTRLAILEKHAKAPQMRSALQAISSFLTTVHNAAEQLTYPQKWLLVLGRIFLVFSRAGHSDNRHSSPRLADNGRF